MAKERVEAREVAMVRAFTAEEMVLLLFETQCTQRLGLGTENMDLILDVLSWSCL